MHRLLFTADDFGLTDGVCAGIVRARSSGVLTRTSAMASVAGSLERLRTWASQFSGPIGAHLQLTDGRPCTDPSRVPSLVDENGLFRGGSSLPWPFDPEEVALEWRAQIQALRGAGIDVRHVDTHHHVHRQPEVFQVFRDLAREYDLPARTCVGGTIALREAGVQCADHCESGLYGDDPSIESLIQAVIRAKFNTPADGLIELVCHPGYVTDDLAALSVYVSQRQKELEILTDPDLRPRLAKLSLELVDEE